MLSVKHYDLKYTKPPRTPFKTMKEHWVLEDIKEKKKFAEYVENVSMDRIEVCLGLQITAVGYWLIVISGKMYYNIQEKHVIKRATFYFCLFFYT